MPRFPPGTPLACLASLAFGLATLAATAAPQGLPGLPGFGLGGSGNPSTEEDSFGDSRDRVAVSIERPGTGPVRPGSDLPVAIVLDIRPGWHVWTNERPLPEGVAAFDGAVLTEIRVVSATGGLEPHAGFAQWPEAHRIEADVGEGERTYLVFEGSATIFLPVTVAADAADGTGKLTVEVAFQACDDTQCRAPATVELSIEVPIAASAPGGGEPAPRFTGLDPGVFGKIRSGAVAPDMVSFDVFGLAFSIDAAGTGFFLLLLVAAVGGLLLNFTPCVLPVLPLKIMGLANAAGNRRRCLALGLALSLGVVLFWLGLAVAIASIQGFTAANQLFQYPAFTIGVGVVIGVMALGMMGLFTIALPQWVYGIETRHDTIPGSVGFGVMTAVLSTPCTAPLMGAAAAWATTQTASTLLTVFGAIGVGMALPYLVLSAFPGLVRNMPKSGPASELIKQVMGLLLLAAAAYFVGAGLSGVLVTPPDPPSRLYWWVVALAGIAAGGWLFLRALKVAKSGGAKVAFATIGLAILALSGVVGLTQTAKGPVEWTYYTPERLAEARSRGDAIVLEFTAEWCLNCKALEAGVLNLPPVAETLNGDGVAAIKIDLTGNNEAGNALLKEVGRVTIPLLVVLGPDGRETLKSDSYTPQQVLDAIAEAKATLKTGG
jgi:thiol:disulfide interchange protein DsbD